jgi:hypothetical protein
MSDGFELSIDTREVDAALTALPRKLRGAIMVKALQLAGDVMLEAIVANAPERTDEPTPEGDSLEPGILKADLHTEVVVPNSDGLVANGRGFSSGSPRVKVGPSKIAGHVARWQNNGWNLTSHGKKGKVIRAIPGKHFLEAGFDESADKAIDVFVESLWNDLFNTEGVGPEGNSHDVDFG